jgi:AAHS family benzoate transporter-like MFS transporter
VTHHLRRHRIVGKIGPDVWLEPHEEFLVPAEGPTVGTLFVDARGFSSLMFWVAFITCLFMLYALSSWLVKLTGMAG